MFAIDPKLPTYAQEIASQLQSRQQRRLQAEHSGRAAVLVPILPQDNGYAFLLTQRTHKVETHKGQISFPGGVQHETDKDPLQTALRETQEEIGLRPERISVLGEFDEYFSITGLIVASFVGWITEPVHLLPNPDEVEEILKVPFSNFQEMQRLRVEKRKRSGVERNVYFYDCEGKEVWGLTAQIIRDLLKLIGKPT